VDGHFSNGGNGGSGNNIASQGQSGSGGGGGGSGLVTSGGQVRVDVSFAGGAGGRGGLALDAGGGGGGGGGYGILATGTAGIVVDGGPAAIISGGRGGHGYGPGALGAALNVGSGFGGGGGVGVGFIAPGSRLDLLSGTITGGQGGFGGDWGTARQGSTVAGGGGGSGGAGVLGSGLVITSAGTIMGGAGGRGGNSFGRSGNSGGVGGDGIRGSGNTIFNSGTIAGGNGGAGGTIYNAGTDAPGLGGVGISGSDLSVTNAGSISGGLADTGAGVRANAIFFSGGVNRLELVAPTLGGTYSSIIGNVVVDTGAGATGTLALGGAHDALFDISGLGASGQYQGFSSFEKVGTGTWTLVGTTGQVTPWALNGGTLAVSSDGGLGAGIAGLSFNGGALRVTGTAFPILARMMVLGAGGGTIDVLEPTHTLVASGVISGSGGLTKTGPGSLRLSAANAYSGGTSIADGALTLAAAGALGTGGLAMTGGTLNLGGFNLGLPYLGGTGGRIRNDVTTAATLSVQGGSFDGSIEDGSGQLSLVKEASGTLTLGGNSTYTGQTLVNDGKLVVNGSIVSSSGVTVAAGARLGGTGTLPTTIVSGGILAPGNSPGTLTVNGNLTLGLGSVYEAEVHGGVSDRVVVTGTAALDGTLRIIPLGGPYTFNSPYVLLSAGLGRTGMFSPVDTTGSFGVGVTSAVDYTANEVRLTLKPTLLAPIVTASAPGGMAPGNASAISSAIDGAVAGGGDPSPLFGIYNQSASALPAAVNQLSGEAHTGISALAFQAAGHFLGTMLDPNGSNRLNGAAGGPGSAAGFTASLSAQSATGPFTFDPARFSLWGATFGSRGRTEGDRVVGSANRTMDDAHLAVGADMLLAPGTVAGVALGIGQARASLSAGLGKVESGVFQAGLYGRTRLGPLDLAAAGGYARLDNDVHRAVPALGNTLSSSYASTAWSGRLQASAELARWNGLTFSPLAALQASHVHSPAFIEQAGLGGNAGTLSVAGRRRSSQPYRSRGSCVPAGRTTSSATPA
jgi:autotransporter-associated beta strand protein